MPSSAASLRTTVSDLRKAHGKPQGPPTRDAFELVLLENVAYLATPDRRRAAFALLKATIGTDPAAILRATPAQLEQVTAHGILKKRFAAKLRECARLARDAFDGKLDAVLDASPAQAHRALRRFPGIGAPGADRILLFSGRLASLAPESNALRVLARLGFIDAGAAYAQQYKAAQHCAAVLPATIAALQEAHLLLRRHGQTLCRSAAPLCTECPLRRECAWANPGRRRPARAAFPV